VNSENLCAPGDQPEKEREGEREKEKERHRDQSSDGAKMGTIKDRNSMDLTEIEDIEKR